MRKIRNDMDLNQESQIKKEVYDIAKSVFEFNGLDSEKLCKAHDMYEDEGLNEQDWYKFHNTRCMLRIEIEDKFNLKIPGFRYDMLNNVESLSEFVCKCVKKNKYQKEDAGKLEEILKGALRGTSLVHGGIFRSFKSREDNGFESLGYKEVTYYSDLKHPVIYHTSKLATFALEATGYYALAKTGHPGWLAIPTIINSISFMGALDRALYNWCN